MFHFEDKEFKYKARIDAYCPRCRTSFNVKKGETSYLHFTAVFKNDPLDLRLSPYPDVFEKDEADKRFAIVKKVFEEGKTSVIPATYYSPSVLTFVSFVPKSDAHITNPVDIKIIMMPSADSLPHKPSSANLKI